MKLDGKVVLIAGASEGIGAACANSFRRRGARLALVARNQQKLEQVGGPDALVLAGDLTQPETRERAVEGTIAHYGTIDVLVNNAGVGLYANTFDASLTQVRAMFELNFFTPLAMSQLVLPAMRKQRSGSIVNVSSIAGQVTLPWLTLYSASKRAVQAMSDGLRMELRRDRIQILTVCPGYVDTDFQRHALGGTPPRALRDTRPLSITAGECAEAIARGVERDARTILTPLRGWALVAAARVFPGLVDWQLERLYRRT